MIMTAGRLGRRSRVGFGFVTRRPRLARVGGGMMFSELLALHRPDRVGWATTSALAADWQITPQAMGRQSRRLRHAASRA